MNAPAFTQEEVREVVRLRDATVDDLNYVRSSWLKSYRIATRSQLAPTVYFSGQHRLIERLLSRSSCVVACSVESPDHIMGYSVSERIGSVAVIHYVSVKREYRRLGLGKGLMQAAVANAEAVSHTHRTKDADGLIASFKSIFNPYLAGEL